MCAIFRRDSFEQALEKTVDGPEVSWDPAASEWYVDAPCESCGGYRMGLEVADPQEREVARSRASAFLLRVHARGGCLGCETRQWRSVAPPTSAQPHVWWDTETA